MKLPSFFSKPRWQSKDAATRRLAVAQDRDGELLASLGRLAREDADAGVRIAAAKRLADPGIAQGLAHDDPDPAVRTQARALWLDLLAGNHPQSPAAAERLRLLKAQDDIELAERIASGSKEVELRRAALATLRRPALLFDRALADPDAGIRLSLVERFDDEATLERLAERARKSDKQVARRARERIDELRLSRGDAATLEQRGRQLCERIEQLLREPHSQLAEAQLVEQWGPLEASLPASLRTRFQAARDLLATSREPPVRATEVETTASTPAAPVPIEDTVPIAAPDTPSVDVAAPLLAQARFAVSLDEAQAARRQQAERQRQLERELGDAVEACERALENGASADAHASKRRIDELRRGLDGAWPKGMAARVAQVETRYADLARWQHWADRQRREQVCAEIEALAEQRLHPDAVANKVRDAQLEWSRLDALEQGSARTGNLNRRFHAACRAAMAPAQGYFRKRHELRQSTGAGIQAVLERVATLDSGDGGGNGAANISARREIVEALRNLDRVEPRERKGFADALKARLAALDARIAGNDAAVEQAKAALIARAETLASEMPKGAVAAARDLQQRWREAGNGKRRRDQAQWETFRAAVDRVFGNLDAERKQRDEADAESRRQAAALCDELAALVGASDVPERAAVSKLRATWDALDVRDDALRQRHADLQQQLRARAEGAERMRRLARFHEWQRRHRICRAAEAGGAGQALTPWSPVSPEDIAGEVLQARFEQAAAGTPRASGADDEAMRDALVDLEIIAGIESAEDDRERRRTRQVARLAARMGGGNSLAPAEELTALLTRWTALGPASDAALDTRMERALAGALEHLP